MPAGELEVHMAQEEGVKMHYLTSPVKIIGDHDRRMIHIECIKNELGEPDDKGRRRPVPVKGSNFAIPVDMVIAAIGQSPEVNFLTERFGIEINRWGMPVVEQNSFMTARKGVFAGGDCITGPRNIIEVVADGRKAARSIHTFLSGEERKGYTFYHKDQSPSERMPNYESASRQIQDSLTMKDRYDLVAEAEQGFSRANTFKEAGRCLLCHYNIFIDETCILCGGCIDVCPYDCISMVSRENVEAADVLQDENSVPGDWDATMVIDEEKCIRCGLCVKRCPVNAITMKRFAYSEG